MCLLQPNYAKVSSISHLATLVFGLFFMQTFDKAIASKYGILKDPDVIDGVTIVADKVGIRQNDAKQWKTFCSTSPASVIQTYSQDSKYYTNYLQILKKAIFCFHKKCNSPEDKNLLHIPKLEISIESCPEEKNLDCLVLNVEGIDQEMAFQLRSGT